MREPIFAPPLSDAERETLKAALRSPDAFTLRRCQILLSSADGKKSAYKIASELGCDSQTVRNVIHKFNRDGLQAALRKGSRRPHTTPHKAFDEHRAEALRAMLHHSPRNFGKDSSLWTLEMAAQASFEKGLTQRRISGETIRATLARMGVRWQLSPNAGSPLPTRSMKEKKVARPIDRVGHRQRRHLGRRLPG
jgi:transposase